MLKRLAHALMAAGTLLLAGCVATRHKPVAVDSPPPGHPLIACSTLAASAPRCDVEVRADALVTDTGIRVAAVNTGSRPRVDPVTLCFEVPPGQFWYDRTVQATPPRPIQPGWAHQLGRALGLLRHPDSGYMALIVGVLPDGAGHEVSEWQDLSGDEHCFTARTSGLVVLYPNDAVSSTGDPGYFYRNNQGRIWVTVTRR